MDDIKTKIIGGAIVLTLGGTGFVVSQSDIANNFALETGMSQEQAQKYVEESQDNLDSFSNIGEDSISEGNTTLKEAADIDCEAYEYEWESAMLSCIEGKNYLQTVGSKEVELGQCYKTLDSDLGSEARTKINECISDIDELNLAIQEPAGIKIFGDSYVNDANNANLYNKSVLKTALESE